MNLTGSIWLAALLLMGAAGLAQPRTLTVPTQYRTIQAAIDAAGKGDTVLVLPGYYRESVDFKGKAIIVKSARGPTVTTLDGSSRQTVRFASGEGRDSVFEGFSVKHTRSIGAELVRALRASPTIRGNHFVGPHAGSAIVCTYSPAALIEDNLIMWTGSLGGIYMTDGRNAIIRRNVIMENYSYDYGGGISCFPASPLIEGNLLVGNTAGIGGGGIYYSGNGRIRGNVIVGNWGGSGGGIAVDCSSPVISENLIAGNATSGSGGGIEVAWYFGTCPAKPQIRENVIVGNYARSSGGGVAAANTGTDATLVNNTILFNRARLNGGGFSGNNNGVATIANTLFHGNQASTGPEIALVGSRLTILHSLVPGGRGSVSTVYAVLKWGPGMVDGPPGFVDGAAADFHLRHDSICRDAGTGTAVKLSLADWEGDPRVAEGAVDVGADEFYPRLFHGPVALRGRSFEMRLLGWPQSAGLVGFATRRLSSPLQIPGLQGGLWLDPATLAVLPAGIFDRSGVQTLRLSVPAALPPGLLATQGLAGLVLTNTNTLEVR